MKPGGWSAGCAGWRGTRASPCLFSMDRLPDSATSATSSPGLADPKQAIFQRKAQAQR